MAIVRCTDAVRRARLVARHHLDGSAPDATTAVRSVVAMHSSDPTTPHLGVHARVRAGGVHDLEAALYDARTLWRLHAMRRTLFVVATDDAPIVRAAAGVDVARTERRKLDGWLSAAGPPASDPDWLRDVEARTLAALVGGVELRTRDLTERVPELATRITVGSGAWSTEVALASRLLFLLALDGHLVRTRPAGTWRSSQYRWAGAAAWFVAARPPLTSSLGSDLTAGAAPDPVTGRDPAVAHSVLARRYLASHGPATEQDLRWWAGWTAARTRAALTAIEAVPVRLDDGDTGYLLPDDPVEASPPGADDGPVVALLPGLDPTPMGWKRRDWYLGDHASALFDTNGNVGPTIWVDGHVVGGWAQRPDGEVVTRLLEAVGPTVRSRVGERASRLTRWLDGVVVTPRFRTPLERTLATT
jgi:hypothetical protein